MSSAVWPKPRAGDYALRFRTELKGGDVAYDLWRDDVENFKHEQRLILFIHGYADPVPAANEVYDTFEDRMDCCFSRKRAWTEGAPIVRVYCPGDVDWL
ncbi:MAG: hypothetical protein P4L87_14235, partial [Formivibrio sp.]|nr:hypothetical protein [Formivibrio sp.]